MARRVKGDPLPAKSVHVCKYNFGDHAEYGIKLTTGERGKGLAMEWAATEADLRELVDMIEKDIKQP